jgi:hypothetical protein
MATNTFPALAVQPPQSPDLMGQYQKLAALRSVLQQQQFQQQMQPLELQQQQQQVEQQRRAMESQQAIAQAYIDSEGDLDQTMVRARRLGALPQDLLALQQHSLAVKDKYASMTKTELENTAAQNDSLRGVLDPIVAESDPAKQAQLWQAGKQKIITDPNAAVKYGITDPSQVPDYQSPVQVKLFDAGLKGGKQSIEDELKAAQAFEATQRGKELQAQLAMGGTPEMQDVRYTNLKAQQAQGKSLGADDQAFIQGYEQRKLLVPQYKIENRAGPQGTWSLVEDTQGNPTLLNSVTGETRQAPGIQKVGTYQRTVAGPQAAVNYASNYLASKQYTGPGDEALMEQFFEMAKPSSGFRMSQPQIDMLKNAQSWMNSAEAAKRHATTGTWFSDLQRQQIAQTMSALGTAKGITGTGGGAAAGYTRIKASDGSMHDIPTANLGAAKKIDPNLQVVQ